MTEYEYLSLRYYNDTSETQRATIENERFEHFIDPSYDWKMSVIRLDMTNTRIPCFIPRIQKPKHDIFYKNGVLNSQFHTQPELYDNLIEDNFPMNFQVMIQWSSVQGGARDKMVGSYINWIPENITFPRPSEITPQSVFENRYFHCYSQFHCANLLANALDLLIDQMVSACGITGIIGNTEIETINDKFTILLPVGLNTGNNLSRFDIIFNQELANQYGFRYTNHPNIDYAYVLKRTGDENTIVVGLANTTYSSIIETYRPTNSFPFKTIILNSTNLPVEQMMRYNNITNQHDGTDRVITDYTLEVDTIASFYDTILYQPQNYDRWIDLNSANLSKKITIGFTLESADKLHCPLYIPPEGSVGILLAFKSVSNI